MDARENGGEGKEGRREGGKEGTERTRKTTRELGVRMGEGKSGIEEEEGWTGGGMKTKSRGKEGALPIRTPKMGVSLSVERCL